MNVYNKKEVLFDKLPDLTTEQLMTLCRICSAEFNSKDSPTVDECISYTEELNVLQHELITRLGKPLHKIAVVGKDGFTLVYANVQGEIVAVCPTPDDWPDNVTAAFLEGRGWKVTTLK